MLVSWSSSLSSGQLIREFKASGQDLWFGSGLGGSVIEQFRVRDQGGSGSPEPTDHRMRLYESKGMRFEFRQVCLLALNFPFPTTARKLAWLLLLSL